MNRLQAEFRRLYLPAPAAGHGAATAPCDLVDTQGRVRALVLELARPADWDLLSRAWLGAQADLGLPAPAIAVSGTDGLQLWFSLVEAVDIVQAQAFLDALRQRYLANVAPHRVRLMPRPGSPADPDIPVHACPVPARQGSTDRWSVFVAQDLAPVFADSPWLDGPPSDEGQAQLLRGLHSATPAAWAAAVAQLHPPSAPPQADPTATRDTGSDTAPGAMPAAGLDPQGFLLGVMNDASVPLALRIEAAKALLPYIATAARRTGAG